MLQVYRELTWRMGKMVRNAYGMAIPEKSRGFSSRTIDEKMRKCLNRVEKKHIWFCRIFKDKSIGDKLRSQNLV